MTRANRLFNQTSRFVLLIILAGVFLYLGRVYSFSEQDLRSYLGHFPLLASGAVFVVLYAALTFFIWVGPKDILRIVAAVVYGPYLSTLLVWTGEMANAVLLFSLSRRLGRGFVESRLKGRMDRMDRAIAETSYWWIFLLRMTPIVPFRFQDLGFGLTRISLKKYLAIAMIASPPRVFFLQFFLALGFETVRDPDRLTAYLTENPLVFGLTAAYLLVSVVMMFIIKGRFSRHEST